MTDNPNAFDQAVREITRDRIAAEAVTVLRPDMEPRERVSMALQAIRDAVATLEMLAALAAHCGLRHPR